MIEIKLNQCGSGLVIQQFCAEFSMMCQHVRSKNNFNYFFDEAIRAIDKIKHNIYNKNNIVYKI